MDRSAIGEVTEKSIQHCKEHKTAPSCEMRSPAKYDNTAVQNRFEKEMEMGCPICASNRVFMKPI